jgi:hypothetical protein
MALESDRRPAAPSRRKGAAMTVTHQAVVPFRDDIGAREAQSVLS